MLETALRLGVTFKNLVNRAGPRCVALETTLLVHGVPRGQGRALAAELRANRVDLICLACYMRLLSAPFVREFPLRILNIHPSLLPKYPGLHPHARALAAGEREHGASVHFVTSELDAGPVLAQVRCAVAANDTETSLADRVLRLEHKLYPRALELLLSGTVGWSNSAATYHGRPLLNPLDLAALPIG